MAFGVSWMSQHVTRCSLEVVKAGKDMMAYLYGTKDLGLVYGAAWETEEQKEIFLGGLHQGHDHGRFSLCNPGHHEAGCWSATEAERVIYGDNTAALAIVQNPLGPWRARHLRL